MNITFVVNEADRVLLMVENMNPLPRLGERFDWQRFNVKSTTKGDHPNVQVVEKFSGIVVDVRHYYVTWTDKSTKSIRVVIREDDDNKASEETLRNPDCGRFS